MNEKEFVTVLNSYIIELLGATIPSHVDKRLLKMERTDATIERFCDMCMAMSWDMAKCDYCEFRFRCYTH